MRLRFTKMQGLGNDFVVLDGVSEALALSPDQLRRLADRRYGVGCDQVLVAEPSDDDRADFRYRIFNADGSEAEHCGNGVRCLYRFLQGQGLSRAETLTLRTRLGLTRVSAADGGLVSADMGPPWLEPASVPFLADEAAPSYSIEAAGQTLTISALSMGNPHAVLLVDDVDAAPVERLGPALERHPRFPNRANVGFLQVLDRHRARLRVFERGVGETPACGTGACAALVAGALRGVLASDVRMALTGGELRLAWAGEGEPVWMTGPAETVFEGSIAL